MLESTEYVVAAVPPKVTEVAPVKPVPVTVRNVPTGPEVGEKPEIAGTGDAGTVNELELEPVPPMVVTEMGSVDAPDGTVAVIFV